MNIKYAEYKDLNNILTLDTHLSKEMMAKKINQSQVLVLYNEGEYIGSLRFGLFWDEIPFMNLLILKKEYRYKRFGTALVTYFEEEMKRKGFTSVMTSTLSNEEAQHFYRKLNYKEVGGFILPKENEEVVFFKNI